MAYMSYHCAMTHLPKFQYSSLPYFGLVLIVFLSVSGCDRAFSDVGAATVEVISPDIQTAITDNLLDLELRVTSVREVTRVRWHETEFGQGNGTDIWQATLPLDMGLNQFVIESFVDDGPTSLDTLSVFRLSYEVEVASPNILVFGTGGHTVDVLPNGDLFLVGGSFLAGGISGPDAHRLPVGENLFRPERSLPVRPRVGHTASVLPDGRILYLGGATRGTFNR